MEVASIFFMGVTAIASIWLMWLFLGLNGTIAILTYIYATRRIEEVRGKAAWREVRYKRETGKMAKTFRGNLAQKAVKKYGLSKGGTA